MEFYRKYVSLKCRVKGKLKTIVQKIFQVQILFSDPRLCPVSQSNLFMQTAAGTQNVIALRLVTGVGICSCSLETMWAFALTFSIKESLETREIAMNET